MTLEPEFGKMLGSDERETMGYDKNSDEAAWFAAQERRQALTDLEELKLILADA